MKWAPLIVLVLSGCAISDQRIAGYKSDCAQMGFIEGTPEFSSCVLRLYEHHQHSYNQAPETSAGQKPQPKIQSIQTPTNGISVK